MGWGWGVIPVSRVLRTNQVTCTDLSQTLGRCDFWEKNLPGSNIRYFVREGEFDLTAHNCKNATQERLGLRRHLCRISLLKYFSPHVHVICLNYHRVCIQVDLLAGAYNLAQCIEKSHPVFQLWDLECQLEFMHGKIFYSWMVFFFFIVFHLRFSGLLKLIKCDKWIKPDLTKGRQIYVSQQKNMIY